MHNPVYCFAAVLLRVCLLVSVQAGKPSPKKSSPSRIADTSSIVTNEPAQPMQALLSAALDHELPGPSRPAVGQKTQAALDAEALEKKRAHNRYKANKSNARKRKLGNGHYFLLRPEHTLKYLPPHLAGKSRYEIYAIRKRKLGLTVQGPLPSYAHSIPWPLLEIIEKKRLAMPNVPLEQIVNKERHDWEEGIRLMNQRDLFEGRSEAEILKAKERALKVRRRVQMRRDKARRRPFPNRPRAPSKKVTQISVLEAYPGEIGESSGVKRPLSTDVGDSSVPPSDNSRKKQIVLPFDLNLSASGGESSGSQ